MKTDVNLNECQVCPTCHKLPMLTMEEKVLGNPGEDYVFRCNEHGHVSSGETLEQALKHWNRYIQFVLDKSHE